MSARTSFDHTPELLSLNYVEHLAPEKESKIIRVPVTPRTQAGDEATSEPTASFVKADKQDMTALSVKEEKLNEYKLDCMQKNREDRKKLAAFDAMNADGTITKSEKRLRLNLIR